MSTETTPKRSVGQPTRLTPELAKKLIRLVRHGAIYASACEACGISQRTRQLWMRRGKKEAERIEANEPPCEAEAVYLEFYYTAKRAEAEVECAAVKYIWQSSSWQAKAWFLAHRYPERWGVRARVEQAGDTGKTFEGVIRVVEM